MHVYNFGELGATPNGHNQTISLIDGIGVPIYECSAT